MATNMEIAQQGERFTVVDPPSLPQKPEFPNRLKFCAIGLGLGVALGAVFAGAFEMMDDRVHSVVDETARGLIAQIRDAATCDCEQCKAGGQR